MAELAKKFKKSVSSLLACVTSFKFHSQDTRGSKNIVGKRKLATLVVQEGSFNATARGLPKTPRGDGPQHH